MLKPLVLVLLVVVVRLPLLLVGVSAPPSGDPLLPLASAGCAKATAACAAA